MKHTAQSYLEEWQSFKETLKCVQDYYQSRTRSLNATIIANISQNRQNDGIKHVIIFANCSFILNC